MKIDKSHILDLLRIRGEDHKVADADRTLPVEVDTEAHEELLARLGLDEEAIVGGLEDGATGSDPGEAGDRTVL